MAGTLSLERSVIHANSPPHPLPCFEREVNVGEQLYNTMYIVHTFRPIKVSCLSFSLFLVLRGRFAFKPSKLYLRPDFLFILKIEETYFACDFSLKSPPFKTDREDQGLLQSVYIKLCLRPISSDFGHSLVFTAPDTSSGELQIEMVSWCWRSK